MQKHFIVAIFALLSTILSIAFSQTPGMIYEPATGAGAAILDPNGDGYTSATTAGFTTDDQVQSEIPYSSLIFPGSEPTSDLNNAPDCGFTDFVDQGDRDPAQKYLSPAGNWMFRLRMGSISPNAKSYSILIDTDGLFGNTGANADPNWTVNNPGFEIEIVLATKFGVFVYDCNNPCTPVKSYTGTTNYQKSIAGSTNCNDSDYFLDFYVVFADLALAFPGINANTPMRYVIVDNTAAQASTICQPNSASDVGGVGQCTTLSACFTEIIDAQAFCSPNTSICTYRSDCPTITQPIASGATSVSGTSSEASGSTIRVYKDGVLIGTTLVQVGGTWSLTGISPALASDQEITATAQAVGEYESVDDCSVAIVGSTCSNPPLASQLTTISGNKGVRITFTTAPPAGTNLYMYNPDGTLFNPSVLKPGSTNPVVTVSGTTQYAFECQTGQCFPSGTYYFSYQQPGQCNSSLTPYCFNTTGATEIPTVTTNPTTTLLTSISGTVPAPDNVSGVNVTVYINGFLEKFTTTDATGNWTATGLTFSPCDTVTVRAARPTECISTTSTAVYVIGGQTTAPIINTPGCVTSNLTTLSGTSLEANGTSIQIFVNGNPVGSPATVSGNAWTVTGLNIAPGSVITAKATAPCKTQSNASSAVSVTTQSANTGLSITTSPVYEQGTTLSGTGTNGSQVQVYIDGYPIGSPVTVSGGVWTLSGIQSYELYPYGELTATATSAGGCASTPISGSTVQCIMPSSALTVNPTSAEFCAATGTVTVQISNSQTGIVYQLFLADGTTQTGSSLMGNGGTLTLTSGTLSASTTLKVKAFKLPPGACYVIETDVVPVTFGTNPTLSLAVSASPSAVCSGGASTITIANSQTGYSYQLRDNADNTLAGSAVVGTGYNITISTGTVTSTTTYNVYVTGPAPASCSGQLTNTATLTVNTNPSAPTASTTVQPTCAVQTGTIVVSSPAQGSGFEYSLDGGTYQTSATFTAVSAGAHTVKVKNTSTSCESPTTSVTVNAVPSAPSTPSVSLTQPTCAVPSGTITFTSQSGVEYSVGSGYQASNIFSGLTPGSYSISVRSTTDNTCITLGTSQTVNAVPTAPTIPSASVTQPTCAVPSGTITFTSQSGVEYSIGSGYQTSNIFSGLTPGSYSISVRRTADNSCITSGTSQTVNAVPSAPTTPTATVTQPTCAVPSGTITFTSQSGVEYSVGTGYQASNVFNGLTPGTYSISVRSTTDNTCITTGTSQTVNAVPTAPTTPSATVTQPTCAVPSGTITFTSQSGVEYSVGSGYQASNIFSGLTPGSYSISVRSTTDNTCITLGTSQTVNAVPTAPTIPSASVTQPTCAVPSGTITFTSQSGVEYSIGSGYQTSNIFSGLTPGSYSISVRSTTDNSCITSGTSQTVNAVPSAPTNPTATVTQPTCAVPSGTITFTSQSGVEYSVGTGYQASNVFNGLTPGTYSISVRSTTDNTCITTGTSQTVNAVPTAPTTPSASVAQPTCAVPSGTITFTSQSGVEYSIGSGYQTSNIFSGLTQGSYSISVRSTTDNSCITSGTSQTVNAVPSAPSTPTATVTQPTCAVPSGTITFTSQSGVEYSVGSGYQASNVFNGLTPGTYSISVRSTTDNTCITTGTSQTVNAVPTAPTTPSATVTQPTCAVPSGTITFTSQSGVEYSVGSGYQASNIFSGLTPGSYSISVRSTTDNTCITLGTSQTVNAVPTAPLIPNGSVTTQPTCVAPNGTIVITSPTGATIEYSINGTTYQSSATFSNVSSGTYNVTARSTVDNTCVSSALSLTVNSVPGAPSLPTASATIQPTCASPSGQITVSSPAIGSGLEYILDGLTPQTSNIFNNVAAGTHQISVINTTTLCESGTVPVIINSLTGAPSTPSASVTQPTCLVSTGTITVTSQSNVEYSVGGTYQTSNIFSGLAEGTYSVVVRNTSDNSCTSGTFVIVDAAPLCNPTAVTDSTGGNEDSPITLNTIQSNDSDVDGNVVASTIDLDPSTPGQQTTLTTADGTWSLNTSTGSVTFTPNSNFNGTSTISYTIQDNAGLTSNTANLIVTVIPVNDPPVVDNDANTVTEDGGPATGDLTDTGDSDPDGTTLTANTTPVSGPSNGSIIINSNGTYSYTPDPGFNGQDTIIVTICDNGTPLPAQCVNDTLIITVTPVNDPPVVDNDANTITEDGGPATGDLTDSGDSDPDGTTLTANTTPVSGPSNGSIIINSNGTYSYTPDPGFNGQDTVVVTICDNGTPLPAQCVNDTLVITVTPVNDPPVVDNDANTITEDGGPATGDLTDSGDSDPDGTTLTANTTPVSGPSNGTITINSTGTYSYTPDPGFNGQDTVVVTICDNGTPLPAQCINDTLIITVTPINDAPNAVTDNSTTNENIPVVIDVTSNDTDSDGNIDETSVNVIDLPSNGSISVDTVTGEITYTPNAGFTGADTLIYQVCDNGTPLPGMCDTAMVIINVLPCGTDLTVDCDGDGVTNGDEIDPDGDGTPGPNGTNSNDPCSFNSADQDFAAVSQAWLNLDCDGDGVTNGDEVDPDGDGTPGPNGTDPNNPCSLNILYQTLTPSLTWLGSDCDEDGVTNGDEVDPDGDGTPGPNGTDPTDPCSFNSADQDLATVSQAWLDADCDGDGVTNGDEYDPDGDGTPGPNGTDPTDPCSFNSADQDLATVSQAWLDADCDGDGVTNGDEVDPDGDGTPGPNGTDPSDPCSFNVADQDLATVSQAWLDADCDGDGVTNGDEVDPDGDGTPGPNGTDPSDPCSFNVADQDFATVSQAWLDADCDGDGVTNGDEVDPDGDGTPGPNGTDPTDPCSFNSADQDLATVSQAWLDADCDGDGVTNGDEIDPDGDGTPGPNGTDPSDPCSFNVADQDFATVSQAWLDADCDGDGVTNGDEIDPDGDGTPGPNGTDPSDPCSFNVADQDFATVSQAWLDQDCDGDGATNGEEIDPDGDGTPGPNGTDPGDPCSFNIVDQNFATVSQAWLDADCDGDGVTNEEEVDPNGDGIPGPNGTDPSDPCSFNLVNQDFATVSQAWLDADCDGDGVTNGNEVDPDGDGIPGPNGTDPSDPCSLNIADQSVTPSQAWLDADCDGDGVSNGEEINGGSDPFNPCDPNGNFPGCNSDISIPEAFTPDGDNTNDNFIIPGIENYPSNKLTFFNRWGNEVFYAEGYNNTWNGTANRGIVIGDSQLPTGTYYYILDLNGDGETIYKGYVYLKR